MNMYMTRYDYDYNREGGDSKYASTLMNDDNEETISGDVRNRPVEQYDQEWNGNTIYRQDYTEKSRYNMKDSLLSSCNGDSDSSNRNNKKERLGDNTAYTKFYFRAGLTPNATADGCHP